MRSMPRSKALSALLERHAERIAASWTRALRELPHSRYGSQPEAELRVWVDRGLRAISRSLATGDPLPVERHLRRVVRVRERLGFAIDEVILGLARLVRCARPVLREELRDDPNGLAAAESSLGEVVDQTVARFGKLFATAMRERVERERSNTARLLEAVEEVARPAGLSSVLAIAARHLAAALDASHCVLFVRHREDGRFSLGASAGRPLSDPARVFLKRTLHMSKDAALREVLDGACPSVCRDDEACGFFGGRSCRSLGLAAVVAIPVLSRGEMAALAVATFDAAETPSQPGEGRLRLAQAMARTLGSVIDNARLFAESQHNLAEIGSLQEISVAMLEENSLGDMLELICRETRRLVDADGCLILLRAPDSGEWIPAASSGEVAADEVRWLAEHWEENGVGRPVEVVMLDDDPDAHPPALHSAEPTLDLPLAIAGTRVGMLHVCKRRGAFDEDDVALLERVAGQATLAVEHERLHREQEKAMIVEERHRLSRDLHDSVTQSIYGVTMFAEAASRLLADGRENEARDHLRELGEIAQQALWEMRLLIFELKPPDLHRLGLESVLRARLGTVEQRAGLSTDLQCSLEDRLPAPIEHGLFRIAQEALNNAIRHARARQVRIELEATADSVRFAFEDDGIGFDLEEGRRKGGMGLRSMEERARSLGGELAVDSRAGRGTRVELVVPLRQHGDGRPAAVGIVTG